MVDNHFLVDERIALKLVELADLNEEDVVFEVGAGEGFLTRRIAQKAPVIAVEKEEFLKLKEITDEKVSIIFGDALEEAPHLHFTKIISNPPFTLLESLLRLLASLDFSVAVFVSPKDFVGRVRQDFFFSSIYAFDEAFPIPPQCFMPPPKTESVALVVMKRIDEKSRFVKTLSLSKMKVKNFLRRYFEKQGMAKRKAKEKVSSLQLPQKLLQKRSKKLLAYEMDEVYTRISENV